ncbi:MAG: SIMPL domain-containing protein, partial [Mobilitalea sp.]
AYTDLETNRNKVKTYLMDKGLTEDQLVFSSITTSINYVLNDYGSYTNEVDNYNLSETVTISSTEIDKITEISRNSTELLNEGVAFESYPPQYLYTKLADIKVTMLAAATKDAKNRAEMIATNAGSELGGLTYADMGVMQITPLYSNEISDYGINDTYSLEKEITAVVHCTFNIEDSK